MSMVQNIQWYTTCGIQQCPWHKICGENCFSYTVAIQCSALCFVFMYTIQSMWDVYGVTWFVFVSSYQSHTMKFCTSTNLGENWVQYKNCLTWIKIFVANNVSQHWRLNYYRIAGYFRRVFIFGYFEEGPFSAKINSYVQLFRKYRLTIKKCLFALT